MLAYVGVEGILGTQLWRRALLLLSSRDEMPGHFRIVARRSWLSAAVLVKELLNVLCSTYQHAISTAFINDEATAIL